MKRIGAISVFFWVCMVAIAALALTWQTANQTTVAWDPVSQLSNGEVLPSNNVVEYVVYLANSVSDPDKTNPSEVWRGPETQATITLNIEGSFWVGVQAVRKLADGTVVGESTLAWSDNPAAVRDDTFGIRYFITPAAATGLRLGQ